MQRRSALKFLKTVVNVILFVHLLMPFLYLWGFGSAWRQTEISSEELKGVVQLKYSAEFRFQGTSFEYVFRDNEENHLYRTNVGYLEVEDEHSENINTVQVINNDLNTELEISNFRQDLLVPVSISQQRKLIWITTFLSAIGIAYSFTMFYILRSIISDLIKNDPFTRSNSRRLFFIGILVLASPIILYLIESAEFSWINAHFQFSGYELKSNISIRFYMLGLGVLFLIASEIIGQSIVIKEENELTV